MIYNIDELGLCSSPFWDANLTWHSDVPDLTPCFEETVLVLLPGLFLLFLLPLDCWWIRQCFYKDIPWSWLSLSKILVLALMMVVITIKFIHSALNNNTYPAEIISPVIQFLIFV
ncbi:multidrug resistance-associated protein 1-like [Macrosteles quadrilineatus]|uniref:multidrug resistance-associated protein 1-like n=1 Tax=Macrosteles quadrilineatus TaxID=74068 RepID=UPI0023E0A81C|nr:multidrug resistance-associated protein 1-like [Macrosteles quadrilineatus]